MKNTLYNGKRTIQEMVSFLSRRYPVLFQSLGEKNVNGILKRFMKKEEEKDSYAKGLNQ